MLRLEGFMKIRKLHQDGLSVSEIVRRLEMDRKTVRKYSRELPREYQRPPRSCKADPFRAFLRERWEQGVENASRLFRELQKRGYDGCFTQFKKVVRPWRDENRERALSALRPNRVSRRRWTGDTLATGTASGCMASR